MPEFKTHKVTVLPGTLEANSIYYVAPAAKPDYIEIYVTGSVGTTVKRILREEDIQALIDASLTGVGSVIVVDDIAARNALSLTQNAQVMVIDATADATVNSGGATYVYRHSNTSWTKIAESESMDLAVAWANISGGPSSTPAQIDNAVGQAHTHVNMTELGKVGESGGRFTYDGNFPTIDWNTAGW